MAQVTPEERDRAKRAIDNANKMLPSLNSLVRTYSKNPMLHIKWTGENQRIEGNSIFLNPPMELADGVRHERHLCHTRTRGVPNCGGCRQGEDILREMMHNVGHVTEGTVAEPDYGKIRRVIKAEGEENHLKGLEKYERKAEGKKLNQYNELSTYVGEHVGQIYNGLEDARVNTFVSKADGTRRMLHNFVRPFFEDDLPQMVDIELLDADQLALISTYAIASGYNDMMLEAVKDGPPEVVDLFSDKEFIDICSSAAKVDADKLFDVTFSALNALKARGFLQEEEGGGGDGDGEEEGEGGEEGEGEGDPQGGEGDQEGEGDPVEDEGEDDRTEEEKQKESEAKEKAYNEAMERLSGHEIAESGLMLDHRPSESDARAIEYQVTTGEWFAQPPINVERVDFHRSNQAPHGSTKSLRIDPKIVSYAIAEAKLIFEENERGGRVRNLKRGRLDGKKLGKRLPVQDPRLFMKKIDMTKRDWAVIIGLDISGSTSGGRLSVMKKAVAHQAALLDRIEIPFSIYTHTGGGRGHGSLEVSVGEVKSLDEKWMSRRVQAEMASIRSAEANLDGHTLEVYRKLAERAKQKETLILYYTDGAMPAENYEEELAVLKANINIINNNPSMHLACVAYANDDPQQYGLETVRMDSEQDLRKVVAKTKEIVIRNRPRKMAR